MAPPFELDPDAHFATRDLVSKVAVPREGEHRKAAKVQEIIAEQETRSLPRPVEMTEYTGMILAFEKKYWELEPPRPPARAYLEKKLEG